MIAEEKYMDAVEAINAVHAEDLNVEQDVDKHLPGELLYSKRMLEILEIVKPDADVLLKLAVQCQHLRRWGIPRDNYPMDRRGYLEWRREVMNFQLSVTLDTLTTVGLPKEDILYITEAISNQGNKSHATGQVIEDTACLVFLKWYMEPFAVKHDKAKVLDILKKTMRKMSAKAINLAPSIGLNEYVMQFILLLNPGVN